MSASKLDWTGTVVSKAGGLTYLFAGPSIDTRIAFAAAIDAGYLTVTWRDTMLLWRQKEDIVCFSEKVFDIALEILG